MILETNAANFRDIRRNARELAECSSTQSKPVPSAKTSTAFEPDQSL
jgi:hypothetical protein